jgi:hypothetical protein
MREAIGYIAVHPGCNKAQAGVRDAVERVIRHGLVRVEQDGTHYRLYLTASGWDVYLPILGEAEAAARWAWGGDSGADRG